MSFHQYERGWFSRLVGENGLLSYTNKSTEGVYICKQKKNGDEILRFFRKFNTIVDFYQYMIDTPTKDRCFFEVILGDQYQKPYFDIDIDQKLPDSGKSLVEKLKKSILEDKRIKESDILVYSSHGERKSSYHIIVNNWCLPDNYTNGVYCHEVIKRIPDDFEDKKYIDSLVYKSIQQLRILGSTKLGHDRFKKVDSCEINYTENRREFYKELFKSLVTASKSCKVLCYKEKPKSVWNTGDQEDLSFEDLENIKNLEIIKDDIFQPQEPMGRMIPLKRLKESYCEICDRKHENENPFLTIDTDGKIYFHCRRSRGKNLIWKPPEKGNSVNFSLTQFYGK